MIKIFNILRTTELWLIAIIVIGFAVRLYKIDSPVADWHSWRQADTAAVSRNFFKEGYNPFIPKYDDMSGVSESPKVIPNVNPNRYRFVEFPIYNSLVYFAYLLHGGVDEKLARLVNILFSLGSIIFIYLLTRKYFGTFTSLVSSFLFALLPFNIFFSRVILPEPSLVFFSLGMVYFVDRWIYENTWKLYFLSFFFIACAFLTKPYAAFYLVPLIYSYYKKENKWLPIPKRYFGLFIPAVLPFVAWRVWMSNFPEGIPGSKWLFDGDKNTRIRFKPSYWRWILGDRFGREILSVCGSVLFFIGLLRKPDIKQTWFLHLLCAGSFLYLIVLAKGNVQHDYYQTFIVPVLVIFTARGFVELLKGIPGFLPRLFTAPMAILFLTLTIYLSWLEVKGLYQINNGAIVEAGKLADAILPKDAKVVAPYQGDTSFLYQINRHGWAVVGYPLKDLHDMFGVNYYISTAKDAKTKWAMRKYVTIVDNKDFVIIDMTRELPGFDYINDKEPQ
jgi:4-amino-4-deoxy-L-arabinose transferase-like glycosyltransferase